MTTNRKMRLGLLSRNTGAHIASWLSPETQASAAGDLSYYIKMVQTAERGKFDFFFETDSPGIATDNMVTWSRNGFRHTKFEPLTLLSVLSASTTHLGLGGTMSTTFNEPYNVARAFASLDLITGGSGGWNVVTTANDYAARNFGLDKLPPHDERYERAYEFVEVVRKLWDTYEDDAFIWNRETSQYIDPDKFHPLEHDGKFFKVHGAIASMRSPQGQPVIFQAGASNAGRDFAAATADVVFGSARDLTKAQALYKDIKTRMLKFGRDPDDLKLLPGLSMVLADSAEEAEQRYQALQDLVHPDVMRQTLQEDLEMNLRDFPLDEPIPEDKLPEKANQHEAYFNYLTNLIRTEKPTLRQLFHHWSNRGRNVFCGTPKQAADLMEQFFTSEAADGFMISFQTMPQQLDLFVDTVIPDLQRRGLFRTEYEGKTLRENLGLKRPKNSYLK